jgi:hypothetical protein
MFHYVLANLLANNKDALGAIFLDGTGETVDLACADFSPHEMKVVGAYLGIYIRHFDRLLTGNDLGGLKVLIYVVPLPDGYSLALVQKHPALVAQARASLGKAVEQLTNELFS